MFTAVQNTPILVNLLNQARDNGWSNDGVTAMHVSCNSGYITLLAYEPIVGHTYQISYSILSISGGNLQLFVGDTPGTVRTTVGLYIETLTTTGANPEIRFFSDANCQIQAFNVRDTFVNTDNKQQNTLCYAAINQKWSDFRTFNPDIGFSLFINTFTLYQGILYKNQNGGNDRNNFYGVQYQSILRFVDNASPVLPKTFLSISLQCNELLITTEGGITTSLGQVSELAEIDFLKDKLSDGISQVDVYSKEGIFAASFLRDKNVDLLNGDTLKGNYLICELITLDNITLNLFSVNIVSNHSAVTAR